MVANTAHHKASVQTVSAAVTPVSVHIYTHTYQLQTTQQTPSGPQDVPPPIYLVVGKHSEDVKICIRSKPETLCGASNNPRHKCPMSQPIIKALLICPVGPVPDSPEVRMATCEPRVKNGHPYALPCVSHAPEYVRLQC